MSLEELILRIDLLFFLVVVMLGWCLFFSDLVEQSSSSLKGVFSLSIFIQFMKSSESEKDSFSVLIFKSKISLMMLAYGSISSGFYLSKYYKLY